MKKLLIVAGVALWACGGSTEPEQKFGPLKSRIQSGRAQTYTAGSTPTAPSVNLSYREGVTGSLDVRAEPLWKRVLLPAVAWAQSVIIQVQPGAVACVKAGQTAIVAQLPCVTADQLGQSRFDFNGTTVAGTHQVLIGSTYGLETSTEDTVTFTVLPGPANLNTPVSQVSNRTSPVLVPVNVIRDAYGNPVPYRIVSDVRITAGGDTVGTNAARTITFSNPAHADSVFYETQLRDGNGTHIGKFRYRMKHGQSGGLVLDYFTCGANITSCQ